MKIQILKVILATAIVSTAALANAASLKPAKSVFKVEATQADKVYIKLIKDRVKMDSCNRASIQVLNIKDIEVASIEERVVPGVFLPPKCEPYKTISGKPAKGTVCKTVITPSETKFVKILEKTGVDIETGVFETEMHCPAEPYLATAVSQEIELDIKPGKAFKITTPSYIDRIELSLRPLK